jgi:hypothetical protein
LHSLPLSLVFSLSHGFPLCLPFISYHSLLLLHLLSKLSCIERKKDKYEKQRQAKRSNIVRKLNAPERN